MARDAGTRVCKYGQCKHGGKVKIDTEPFVKENGYYHEDCYQEKCDLQRFRNLWRDNISTTVVYSQLNKTLNQLISNGISTDYMLFALQYVIKNGCKLNYPSGFRYYLDYPQIKEAYAKSKAKKVVATADFTVKADSDDAPKFSVNRKPTGFNSILGGKH